MNAVENDAIIESLRDELRSALSALNDLHHPVYPARPERIAEVAARVERIRADLQARRRELAG